MEYFNPILLVKVVRHHIISLSMSSLGKAKKEDYTRALASRAHDVRVKRELRGRAM